MEDEKPGPEDIIHKLLRLGGEANEAGDFATACGYAHAAYMVATQIGIRTASEFAKLRDRLADKLATSELPGTLAARPKMLPGSLAAELWSSRSAANREEP